MNPRGAGAGRVPWWSVVASGFAVLGILSCGEDTVGPGPPPPPPPPPPMPTSVTVTPAGTTLSALGATVQLSAEVRDQAGRVMGGAAVTWSSGNASVATVDASGAVTAVGNGAATITAAAGAASGTASVTVAQEAATVAVTPAADTLVAGDTLRLAAEAFDTNGHAVEEASFAWSSSDASVAGVDGTGLVTAVTAGTAVVTAASSGVSGSAELVVVAPVPAAVSVRPDTVRFTALGQSVQLSAEVRDQVGRVMEGVSVMWSSSDPATAVVDEAGRVTAAGNGTATITAAEGEVSGAAAVTVAQEAATVAVTPAADTLVAGDTLRLAAEAFDANGHAVAAASFAWSSSDASVAGVDGTGLVTAVTAGTAVVTAASSGVSGSAELVVVAPVPTAVSVRPETVRFTALGQSVQLSAEVRDQVGRVMEGVPVTWTSADVSVATVDTSGAVTAAGDGVAAIAATAGGAAGAATVTVAQEVNTVAVTPATDTLVTGDTLRLSAQATDANGHAVTGASFAWSSSDVSVAGVDESGTVTAVAAGTAVVTAASSGALGSAELVVVAPAPAAVAVRPDTVRFTALGQSVQLSAEVRDRTGRVMDGAAVTWSSADDLVATVDSLGVVTAVGAGATSVAAVAGEAAGEAVVLMMQSVGSVVVSPTTATITPDDTLRLAAEAFDENGHRVDGAAFSWTSSDAAVARVDDTGLVAAVAVGTATVTASAGGEAATATITVENRDRAALVALYEATGGPNWRVSRNWLSDAPINTWHGVQATRDGRVLALHLSRNGLAGSIPAELGNLTRLTGLALSENQLTGPIPPEIGNLSSLTELWLSYNRLTGTIPVELGNLTSLKILSLSSNQLTGPIPRQLGSLVELTNLGLSSNRLTGSIPAEFGDLIGLEELWLGDNQLTGTVPAEFGNFANLKKLTLSDNGLTEPVPGRLLDLRRLTTFYIQRNEGLCVPGTRVFVDWIEGIGQFLGQHCNDPDFTVLQLLHETTGGGRWLRSDGWGTSNALAEWYGVTTDTLGHVVALDLSRNGLSGQLPTTLGLLSRMTELRIGANALRGRLPLSLADLALREFHYAGTGLCHPREAFFIEWLNDISSHTGTGVECPPLSERDMLVAIYDALGGPEWANNANWRTEAPLRDWHGVEVDHRGRVVSLRLYRNRLQGAIPPIIGSLTSLVSLQLEGGGLRGPIPPELGDLRNLEYLNLKWNRLRHPIPPELGNLAKLRELDLELARLSGSIPPELGRLANLRYLNLSRNGIDDGTLSGPIPSEIGNLSNLRTLRLGENDLTGPIPLQVGRLINLSDLDLSQNRLTGSIPSDIGGLTGLRSLNLNENDLTGAIPTGVGDLARLRILRLSGNPLGGTIPGTIGGLAALEELWLERTALRGAIPPGLAALGNLRELRVTGSAQLEGTLPTELTGLRGLEALLAGGTRLCAPAEPGFQAWLQQVPKRRIAPCSAEPVAAYLIQAAQSRDFPVPLVAGERALLRVFVASQVPTNADIPDVRATFYLNGTETYAVTIPSKPGPIPTAVWEGSLRQSANIEIPGRLIAPRLELVIEIDPAGTLDAGLGVARRIPESGRLAVDVHAVPLLDLTLVPFVVIADPDLSIVGLAQEMAADPENHEVLWGIRDMMPVADLEVTAHPPVWTSTDDRGTLLEQTDMIRVAEGARGHYMGMLPYFVGGVAFLGGKSSFSNPFPELMAHEIGHNFNLLHAPCPPGINRVDPSFPHPRGVIGVWGYDFRDGGRLVDPATSDVMGYCGYDWPSDYHFTNALRYRLFDEGASGAAAATVPGSSLLVWGGVAADGALFLEPAFVVDAPAALPDSIGDYGLAGRTADGRELFALRFAMSPMADADGRGSFVFALPVRPGWQHDLDTITLSGPGGSVTLDGNSDVGMAILRDPRSREIRGILRDLAGPLTAQAAATSALAAERDLEVLFSRGIPDPDAWRR